MSIFSMLLVAAIAAEPIWSTKLKVDLGVDRGQNFGSLFEATSEDGKIIVGAGFVGSYNTLVRGNRMALQFFVRHADYPPRPKFEALPRPTADCGVYLSEINQTLFAASPIFGVDRTIRYWNAPAKAWMPQEDLSLLLTPVADGFLRAEDTRITFKNRPILDIGNDGGMLGSYYYANGWLICRVAYPDDPKSPNRLIACFWSPEWNRPAKLSDAISLALSTPNEFTYACGQIHAKTIVTTNLGGVHAFDGKVWTTLRHPQKGVSFQIYAGINYHDRLLLGQYPTGNLFDCDGVALRQIENWPPKLPEVSPHAREAQTLAIAGGELYCGVWPWAEIWRLDRFSNRWEYVGRPFTHPEPTDAKMHPYEVETAAVDPVFNFWGQRITSLLPVGGSLYVGTSAKSCKPFDAKFAFLSNEKHREYGIVHRMQIPGQLTAAFEWTGKSTTLEFAIHTDRMTIAQDGRFIGQAAFEGEKLGPVVVPKVTLKSGVFGELTGKLIAGD